MRHPETVFPRALATLVLLASIAMLIPLGKALARILHNGSITPAMWLAPLLILATGLALLVALGRRTIVPPLYLMAFALWMITAGYVFVSF